jgi:hypothetical protein
MAPNPGRFVILRCTRILRNFAHFTVDKRWKTAFNLTVDFDPLIVLSKVGCNDKGKPVARWGRKAVNLLSKEIVWLPKAICNETRNQHW